VRPGSDAAESFGPHSPMHRSMRDIGHRRYARHQYRRGWGSSSDHMANRLNRASLYGGWGAAVPQRGLGPAPYSANGP